VDDSADPTPTGKGPLLWVFIAGIVVAYVVTAKLGIELSVAYSSATPVWAPVGISLAGLLLFGCRAWPAVTIGAFAANAMTPVPIWVAGVIAIGNTLEAVIGAELLIRVSRFRPSLERVKDVLALVFFAAIISTAVSATIGTTALAVSGEIPWGRFAYTWQLWWHGDAMGDLIVAPLLLSWGDAIRRRERPQPLLEEAILMGSLVLAAALVFFGGSWRYPYILFPFLIWAALRFKQRGATTVVFVISVLAIWGILAGSVPVGGVTATASVQIFQTLMGLLAITSLILTASVAEKEKSRVEMNEAASLLQAALDSTTDGILVLDLDGQIRSFNQRFFQMWNIPPDSAAPGDDALVLAPFLDRLKHPEQVYDSESALYAQPESVSVDELELKDGRTFERYSQAQRVDGVPVGRVWSFRDVTKQKELEAARGRFIHDAAHELRNPAAAIIGMADLLEGPEPNTNQSELRFVVEGMGRQATKMSRLLDRMLDLGRLERPNAVDNLVSLGLADVVDAVLETLIVPEGRSITTSVAPELTALVERGGIEQVLENLLTNAFRYGGPTITISAAASDDKVHLLVADDGPGVPESFIEHVFEPFHRGVPNTEGFGLGLSIVRTLVARMHGEIAYVPIDPHGAAFRVTLSAG
jgi:signal transduction histidine kinase